MQTLQASRSLSGRAQARPASAGRRLRVKAAGLSPEQQAFLERKAREARNASPAPSRGRSGSSRPPPMRPTSRPSSSAAPSYSAPSYSPAPAAPSAGGLSAEQQAFLARKAQEARSASPAAAAPTRGRLSSPRPSFRAGSSPAPAAAQSSYGYSAPAAPSSNGLSAEQQAFLARKAQESRSASPAAAAPTRGRSASPRPSFRASSSPAPAAARSSFSSPAPTAANGLSAEQQAFLARKSTESRSPPPAAPARGRSSSPRPSFRASSPPAPAAAQSSYSPPAPAAANGLSAEQQAFLARKATESRSPPPAAPARGRSSSARPSSRQPSAAPSSYQASPPPSPEPRVTDVEFARAALERTIQERSAIHPRDPTRAPPPPAQATGPSTGRWPDPAFFHETLQAFPAKSVCNAEEARCLIDAGYAVLDVRPELESNRQGKLRGSVPIPCTFQRQQFDPSTNEMVISEEDNPSFLAQVFRKFPRKDARIIVACSNGKSHSIDVLEALEEEGYTHIVGMMGGFNAFYRTFDNRLNPKDGRPKPRRAMKKLL
ncbi:hypothetical protein ABPG77_010158 [Micractinium sp. CCAP 211/92]